MKHLQKISKKAPAQAGILNWISQLWKTGWGPYAGILGGQPDFRTADAEDGDFGNPNEL